MKMQLEHNKKKSYAVENIYQRMTQMSFYLSEAFVAPISGAAAFIRKCTTNIWIRVSPTLPKIVVIVHHKHPKFINAKRQRSHFFSLRHP